MTLLELLDLMKKRIKLNEPARAYEGTAAEHAARIIALVVADNPIPGRKAV